jgi:hypothetical protein
LRPLRLENRHRSPRTPECEFGQGASTPKGRQPPPPTKPIHSQNPIGPATQDESLAG